MRIEDRMSMWAAKKPRDEVAELLLEGAQEIADLRRHREEDGEQMGALIAGYQKMQGLCIDGKYLTDEEREAVDRARRALRDMDHNAMTMQQLEDYEAICGLLERMRSGALTGCETVSQDGDCPVRDNSAKRDILTDTHAAHATPTEGSVRIACTLTDEEREAVELAAEHARQDALHGSAATLLALLERTK